MQPLPEKLSRLSPERRRSILGNSLADMSEVFARVREILADLKTRGDKCASRARGAEARALRRRFSQVRPEDIVKAYAQVPAAVAEHLKERRGKQQRLSPCPTGAVAVAGASGSGRGGVSGPSANTLTLDSVG
jgi:hypothetical protein